MRIGLLTAWVNRANGGVFEAVVAHAKMLADQGFAPQVFALARSDDAQYRSRLDGIPVTTVPVLGPNMIGYGMGLGRRLVKADLDLVHLHGIWTHVSADGAYWARRTKRPYVISTHGMCDQWTVGRGKLKKAVARVWFERRNWNAARVFHALTGQGAHNITAVTGRRDFAVIPNGLPIPAGPARPAEPPTMLCIARIHAVKNLGSLIEGWRLAQAGGKGWRLVLAGWGAPADEAQFRLALGSDPAAEGIHFIGPVFGGDKERLLSEASFVVLPSLSEALPMGILEGWAAGVPALMTDVIPLPEGFKRGAAIGMGTSPADIMNGLRRAMALSTTEREAMARAARDLAIERFSDQAVAASWTSLYRSLAATTTCTRALR